MEELLNRVNTDWLPFFDQNKDELEQIISKLDYNKYTIFPNKKNIFKSLFYHKPNDIKLVIIGQDCYISSETINDIKTPQAVGLSFSIPKYHKKIPPSLKNIFKEIKNCYPEYEIPTHGSLKRWAKKEKILLLNSALTVLEGKSNSHAKIWEEFTNKLIKWFCENNNDAIFLLMGNYAISKSEFINEEKHKIFKCGHPSPLNRTNPFIGCEIFKKINNYLLENNKDPINW
jgi:uracil-DNA glycosylase